MCKEIQTRIAQRYGATQAGSKDVCPTEEKCDWFQDAYDDPELGKAHVCESCPMLPTKIGARVKGQLENLVNRIEQLTGEVYLGNGISDEITMLEYRGLVEWIATEADYRRTYEMSLIQLSRVMLRSS